MQIGMIGLGRMGANMSRRLMRGGHQVVAHDRAAEAVEALAKDGAVAAQSVEALVKQCRAPRVICLMVPAGLWTARSRQLVPLLRPDDVVIDGGNSHYHDDIARAPRAHAHAVSTTSTWARAAACGDSSAAIA